MWTLVSGWPWVAGAGVVLTALLAAARHWRQRRHLAPTKSCEAGPADPVTGLLPRAAFDEALDEAVHRCDHSGQMLAVVCLGLDNFRLVNEACGHATGDRLLAQVPARLHEAVSDLIGATRSTGDEFVLALPGGRDAAQQAATRLREALEQPFKVDGHELSLDASLGYALYPQHGARSRLLVQAVAAMRAVKQAGGGDHAEFVPAMGVDMRQRVELLRDLRLALAKGALQLVYQPQVDANSLQVTAAEALLRWHDEARGLVSPVVFVPLAEKHGLIGEIGRWVIEQACRQAGAWRAQGLNMRVAVNLSGYQMRQDDMVEHLVACLQQHGIAPSRFTCEIPETVAMEATRVTHDAFERLRQAGVHLSIDDFGTGLSSLATLRKLPVAELKIDRAFVADLASSAEARSTVAAIVRMAHTLNLRVVAEGVETEDQRDRLLQLGCDEMQGYLFAKPMTAKALGLWAHHDGDPAAPAFKASLLTETLSHDDGSL